MTQNNIFDREYHKLLQAILDNGYDKTDRTGTGTRALFGMQCKFPLMDNKFPLLTTKKMFTKAIIHELLWFIKGETNIEYLLDHDVHIWDQWTPAYKKGGKEEVQKCYIDAKRTGISHPDLDLGPVYGSQWRSWEASIDDKGRHSIDQLVSVIERIKVKPDCRRLIVTAWNPNEIDKMGLPPCHCLFQFNVMGENIHLQLYQRSCDVFLGVPFNIASYALLLHMVAHVTGLKPGYFIHTYGDVHIYNNHFDQVKEQLARPSFEPPTVWLNPKVTSIEDFTYEDIRIENYESHGPIKAEVSV